MEREYRVDLLELSSERDLWVSRTAPVVEDQLRRQGRTSANSYRYEVVMEIVEGKRFPAADVDNYAKKAIDAVTRAKLLWRDDKQIDALVVRRRRDHSKMSSSAALRITRVVGQHAGVPTFFRARCYEARLGQPASYADAGYHLAIHLNSQQPYDLDGDAWAEEVNRMCGFVENKEEDRAWNWFREHFPKCMALVPKRRCSQFLAGVARAHEDGRIEA